MEMTKFPLGKFVDGYIVISGVHIDFREDADDLVGEIEVAMGLQAAVVVVVGGGVVGEEEDQSYCSDYEKEYGLEDH